MNKFNELLDLAKDIMNEGWDIEWIVSSVWSYSQKDIKQIEAYLLNNYKDLYFDNLKGNDYDIIYAIADTIIDILIKKEN